MFIQFLASQLILLTRMPVRLGYLKPAYKFTKDYTGLRLVTYLISIHWDTTEKLRSSQFAPQPRNLVSIPVYFPLTRIYPLLSLQ